jgi:hypothetical protein
MFMFNTQRVLCYPAGTSIYITEIDGYVNKRVNALRFFTEKDPYVI